ncbi:glycerophosphodiester phosphodiesterase [Streptomyces malaysiensis subsp. malaysiensis]|uniref:glycerophosphodiester phosphodiesterase n=5 Tax=Streptomyces TaxID=1883 RepID=A0ABX6WI03_STRMQ|nr:MULTISPECIES: glycerophosphodiester phosphodiesterase [Streptomyces]ATL86657.1 putative glycerophosphoryl diester phosphodiesterase [Streptomyces malaysiensis]AUA10088.1 Glycerophosphoryl diester phosphodiesterase precursor [Streptomyces sp. M56]MCC4315859.1 glycerophosphodiester phosphodiesterase [Streptomyces malaysiensis]QPI59576.1 glycerophosphodiester phosphodiesterase [Streptomyces solisilvae]UHH21235.1 glycerophosphodiester phosphodiesterase [Streptomyces sp. HNM0561]
MEREQQPGRRTLLGAAALGAGAMALSGAGTATAAGTQTAPGAATAAGASGRGHELPVPTVIGHRGASGYRPEHTFGSYQLALDMGADIIEQDLVPTKDGHLVCRHENDITATTDVSAHPEFADRKTTKTVDGAKLTGWFTEDFTLAELKTLRAKERIPGNRQRNTLYDGRWEVPTFEEVLQWADREGRRRGRRVWLYVETKHPTYFRKLGLGLEEPLAKLLRRYGRHKKDAALFLQSFEPSSIQRLRKLVDTPGVVLLSTVDSRPWDFVEANDPRTVGDLVKPEGLKWIASYAQGIGPDLSVIIPRTADGKLGTPTSVVKDAHAAGLILHPYTMRNENTFLPADFRRGTDPNAYGDAFGAFKAYFATGIDGIFSDNADTALLAAADFRK